MTSEVSIHLGQMDEIGQLKLPKKILFAINLILLMFYIDPLIIEEAATQEKQKDSMLFLDLKF